MRSGSNKFHVKFFIDAKEERCVGKLVLMNVMNVATCKEE
jgi:hypothetical protein